MSQQGLGCARKIGGYDGARSAERPGAPVAELVDAADSKSVARKGVLVRVRPGAPNMRRAARSVR